MAVSSYCIKPGQSPSAFAARAAALGCNVNVGDPTSGTITLWPSAVVVSSQLAPAVFPDNTSQASAAIGGLIGAVLTAAQTLVLANMLVGVGQVLLVLTAEVAAL